MKKVVDWDTKSDRKKWGTEWGRKWVGRERRGKVDRICTKG